MAAICFDVYGTLFDTDTVGARVRERLDLPAGVCDSITAIWREKQLQYAAQVALMDAYRPFWEVTADALAYALDYHGVDARATDTDAILGAYEDLAPYDDAVEALDRLEGADATLAILSNGNPEMLETLAENAGIAGRFDAVVSADEVGTYKPHPAVYGNAAERLDVSLEECWLVSANAWDAAGAAHAGLQAAWVDRENDPAERVGGEPSIVADSLVDVAAALV